MHELNECGCLYIQEIYRLCRDHDAFDAGIAMQSLYLL